VRTYRGLHLTEDRFKVLRDFLGLRPVRHFTESRVHGHIGNQDRIDSSRVATPTQSFPSAQRRLGATVARSGIYHSTDGGLSWQLMFGYFANYAGPQVRISVIPYTQFGVFEREVSEAA
jgi:hypothetical protein